MKAKQFKIIFLAFLSTVKFQAIFFRCPLYEQNGIRLKLSTCFYIIFQKLFVHFQCKHIFMKKRPATEPYNSFTYMHNISQYR